MYRCALPRYEIKQRMSLKIFMVLVACLVSLPAHAQEAAWPTKPIKLVVPYTPGGGTDILGRMLGRRLSEV